jgi:hypothetical protein
MAEDVAERDIPLRLRRRRDKSLCLVDEMNRIASEGHPATFPPRHEFSLTWLLDNGRHVTVEDDTITLNLANGTAVYRRDQTLEEEVFEIDNDGLAEQYGKNIGETAVRKLSNGYWGVLESAEYFDAPDVEE